MPQLHGRCGLQVLPGTALARLSQPLRLLSFHNTIDMVQAHSGFAQIIIKTSAHPGIKPASYGIKQMRQATYSQAIFGVSQRLQGIPSSF